ncbi:MAG: hypothetical protein AAGA03_10975 [Planctomycetota bacterium]
MHMPRELIAVMCIAIFSQFALAGLTSNHQTTLSSNGYRLIIPNG